MADSDGKHPRRARTDPGTDNQRDVYVPKHPTPAAGVPVITKLPALDSVPVTSPDPVEVIAARVDTRTRAVAQRPGPTPTQGAIHAALTVQSIKELIKDEVSELRKHIDAALLAEWQKDRDVVRKSQTTDIDARSAWGKLVRDGVWKLVAGGAVIFAILREWISSMHHTP